MLKLTASCNLHLSCHYATCHNPSMKHGDLVDKHLSIVTVPFVWTVWIAKRSTGNYTGFGSKVSRNTEHDVITGFVKVFQSLAILTTVFGEYRFEATLGEIASTGLSKLPGDHVLSE